MLMPPPDLPSFAMFVRESRRKLGLSQKRLAERAGLPVYRVEEVEQGRWPKKNYLKTLLGLSRALGVSASDLDDRLQGET